MILPKLLGSLCAIGAISCSASGLAASVDTPAPVAGSNASPGFAVYRWGAANKTGGAKAVDAFAQWINRPVIWAEDFEPNNRWENNIEAGGWQLGEWSAWKKALPGRRLVLSIPLLPGGWNRGGADAGPEKGQPVSWTAAARGDYDEHFKKLAENLVKYDLGDTIVRLGWEFNGGWYTWRASDNPKAFATYWGRIVTAMRAVPGAEKLQYCWNPAKGWLQFPADQAWPGDQYVDVIGLDLYDESWAKNTYPLPPEATPEELEARRRRAWNDDLLNGDHGIMVWKKFAEAHHKPLAFPEWGICIRGDKHGGGDNPYFIEQMGRFILNPANNVAFHCYFDVGAPDGDHQLSPGIEGKSVTKFPLSAAKFQEIFRGPATR